MGDRLPAETDLARHYRVSMPTMRAALALLEAEGIVEKHHGRGNFIRRPDERIRYDNQRLFSPHPAPAEAELHVHVSVHR
ncbi:winged helix-turn-helix domain-containing protein, partial [Streptomyces gamaensis]